MAKKNTAATIVRKERKNTLRALISTKYQIVIPKEIRNRLGLKPGQKMTFVTAGSIIHLVPERPFASLRGIAEGVDLLENYRDKSDRP